jgi:hypothetical protein
MYYRLLWNNDGFKWEVRWRVWSSRLSRYICIWFGNLIWNCLVLCAILCIIVIRTIILIMRKFGSKSFLLLVLDGAVGWSAAVGSRIARCPRLIFRLARLRVNLNSIMNTTTISHHHHTDKGKRFVRIICINKYTFCIMQEERISKRKENDQWEEANLARLKFSAADPILILNNKLEQWYYPEKSQK